MIDMALDWVTHQPMGMVIFASGALMMLVAGIISMRRTGS
jgi:hypothetical protein